MYRFILHVAYDTNGQGGYNLTSSPYQSHHECERELNRLLEAGIGATGGYLQFKLELHGKGPRWYLLTDEQRAG